MPREQAGAQLDKRLLRCSGHKPPADTTTGSGCPAAGGSLLPPGPVGSSTSTQGFRELGLATAVQGGSFGPGPPMPPLPAPALPCCGTRHAVTGCGQMGGHAVGRAGRDGSPPESPAGPATSPPAFPCPCLQCPAPPRAERGARTRLDTCFRLAQTMTHVALGCEQMRSSPLRGSSAPGTDPSPVPRAELDAARARGLWGHAAPGARPQPTPGASWLRATSATLPLPCASLGTAFPGLAHSPGPGSAAPQHLSWSRGCAGGCPCGCPYCVAPCLLGSDRQGVLHPAVKWGHPVPCPPVPPDHPTSCPGPFPGDLTSPLMQAG